MKNRRQSPHVDRLTTYQIRVIGRLDQNWSDWFDGMVITFENESGGFAGTTMTGTVVDQAALYGILNRIRDLNIPLLSVQLVSSEDEFGENIS